MMLLLLPSSTFQILGPGSAVILWRGEGQKTDEGLGFWISGFRVQGFTVQGEQSNCGEQPALLDFHAETRDADSWHSSVDDLGVVVWIVGS